MLSTATNWRYFNQSAGDVRVIPIGATDIGVLLQTGTATMTTIDGAQTLTLGLPTNKLGPLKTAITVTFGSPGTGVVEYCVC